MTAWRALPPIAREILQSGAFVAMALGIYLLYQVVGQVQWAWVVVGLVVVFSVACFRSAASTDPIAFLWIVVPPLVIALVAVVAPRYVVPLDLLVGAWLSVWLFATPAIWPWWSTVVLRRLRPGTPEGEVRLAYRRLYLLTKTDGGWWDWDAWTTEVNGASRWLTPRTGPVLAAMTSVRHVWATAMDGPAMDRVLRRLGEEVRRLVAPQPPAVFRSRTAAGAALRSTAGTSLEYEYPRLEALLAEATPQERHRMGIEAARIALEVNEILTPAHEAILGRGTAGVGPPEDVATIGDEHSAILDAWVALDAARSKETSPDLIGYRKALALSALLCAISPLDWPLDETDAIYEAASSLPDGRDASALEAMAEEILGPERSARAEIIPTAESPANVVPTGTNEVKPPPVTWPFVAVLPRGWRGIGQLILLALAAEVIATVVENLAWPVYAGNEAATDIDRVMYATVAWMAAYVIVRAWSGRPSFNDAILLYLATALATRLFTPVVLAAHAVINPVAPGLWAGIFDVVPYVVRESAFHGIALVVVLVALALVLKGTRAALERRRRMQTPSRPSVAT